MDFYSAVSQLSERSQLRTFFKKWIFIQQYHNSPNDLNYGQFLKNGFFIQQYHNYLNDLNYGQFLKNGFLFSSTTTLWTISTTENLKKKKFYSAVSQLSERSQLRKIFKKFTFIQQWHNSLNGLNYGKFKKKKCVFHSAVSQLSKRSQLREYF
jgi:hypothetical protein